MGDKDFQLFYSFSDKAVGMSMLTHRPIASEDGYFSLMINPSMKGNKAKPMPRDFVLSWIHLEVCVAQKWIRPKKH